MVFYISCSNLDLFILIHLFIDMFISAMSELLFECYNVPSVAYGIDSLFSLYHNSPISGEHLFYYQIVFQEDSLNHIRGQ